MPEWQRWKNIMKCYPFEEKRLAKWSPPFIVQPKYDGVRCRAIPTDTGYLLVSSEENIIYSVPHINDTLDKNFKDVELDGELYRHGMSFENIVSITSRTINLHPDRLSIKFHIFDVVNSDVQLHRTIYLANFTYDSLYLEKSPYWICESLDDVMRAYDNLINLGYEGIIVRNAYAVYERKRSTWVMKFKPKKEDVYEIVGAIEEVDQYGTPKDCLGAIVCKSGDGNLFHVGTGFTEERRYELWDIKGILPNMVAKVKYQHLTVGKQVPRFPVFVEIMKGE